MSESIRDNIESEMADNGEAWTDVVAASADVDLSAHPFSKNDRPDFLVWTTNYVYFPHYHDGWCYGTTSAPRNPPKPK